MIEIQIFEGHPSIEVLEDLSRINNKIFAFDETSMMLSSFFRRYDNVLICFAKQENQIVGFKAGVLDVDGSFDSWRGGVVKEARRQGIAKKMMHVQHTWCIQQNVRVIKTTTNGDNTAMLILNLQSGFEIVGCFVNRRNKCKILQEKWL